MRGYPFGPGGYGGLLLLFRHFQTRAKDAAPQSKAASRVLSSVMSRDELGEGRETGSRESNPSDRPQIYILSVNGNPKERFPAPGGAVNAERPLFIAGRTGRVVEE